MFPQGLTKMTLNDQDLALKSECQEMNSVTHNRFPVCFTQKQSLFASSYTTINCDTKGLKKVKKIGNHLSP